MGIVSKKQRDGFLTSKEVGKPSLFYLAKAVLEGVAFSLGSILEIINGPVSSKQIRMIGGMASNYQ
jgi:sugar (pentulose or hexulose) kinase